MPGRVREVPLCQFAMSRRLGDELVTTTGTATKGLGVPGPVTESLCWSHGRRKFYELADLAASKRRGKGAAPIAPLALEAVKRIDALFDIEREINVSIW